MNTVEDTRRVRRKPSEERRRVGVILAALRRDLSQADPGTLAALRRMNPASPPPAFYRFTAGALSSEPEPMTNQDQEEIRWAVVARAMATMIGSQRRKFLDGLPFGRALALAGISEARVLKLLHAHGEQLHTNVQMVIHHLAAKAQAFDPFDLALLVLTESRKPKIAEYAKRSIARQFYY